MRYSFQNNRTPTPHEKFCLATLNYFEKLSSESPVVVQSNSQLLTVNTKLQSPDWTGVTLFSNQPPYNRLCQPYNRLCHTTRNFSSTSRGPTTKCYTFLETSYHPELGSQLRCKYFANFFAILFCKPIEEVLPPCVIYTFLETPHDLHPESQV